MSYNLAMLNDGEYFMDCLNILFFFKPQMHLNSENSLVLVLDAIESYRNLLIIQYSMQNTLIECGSL